MNKKTFNKLNFLPENVLNWVIKNCVFEFGWRRLQSEPTLRAYHAGRLEDGKYHLRFKASNPWLSTILHELAHAYLDHEVAPMEERWRQQEREADELSGKWLKHSKKGMVKKWR